MSRRQAGTRHCRNRNVLGVRWRPSPVKASPPAAVAAQRPRRIQRWARYPRFHRDGSQCDVDAGRRAAGTPATESPRCPPAAVAAQRPRRIQPVAGTCASTAMGATAMSMRARGQPALRDWNVPDVRPRLSRLKGLAASNRWQGTRASTAVGASAIAMRASGQPPLPQSERPRCAPADRRR